MWIHVCMQTPTACTFCSRSVCVRKAHEGKEGLSNRICGCLLAEKFSLHPGNDCMSVLVILVCPFFLPISACWIWGKKGRKAVKARCLCPPFLLMINVWLFSEEKCLGIRAFEVNSFKLYPSSNPAGIDNSVWWQSHNICSTCTLIYLRQPSSPTDWRRKALKCESLTWKRCLVKSRAQEVKLRWCCQLSCPWCQDSFAYWSMARQRRYVNFGCWLLFYLFFLSAAN